MYTYAPLVRIHNILYYIGTYVGTSDVGICQINSLLSALHPTTCVHIDYTNYCKKANEGYHYNSI